jgi:catechol 2,3-dioxygenase-like lactoylglutathione lyase family enzyme
MKSEFPGAVPEIPVRDINEAVAYYESNLGFTLDWGGEEVGLAGISKGNCRMFLANQEYRKEYGNSQLQNVLRMPNNAMHATCEDAGA